MTEAWKKVYTQQAVVRKLITTGQGDTEEFWTEHKKLIALQDKACNPQQNEDQRRTDK